MGTVVDFGTPWHTTYLYHSIMGMHGYISISLTFFFILKLVFSDFISVNSQCHTWHWQYQIHTVYTEDSGLYLDELCTLLAAEHGIIVSQFTLCWNLKEAGLTQKILHKMALESNEALREDWKDGL